MTPDLEALERERLIVSALLPVQPEVAHLGTVLMVNTLRRAMARLVVHHDVREPDWAAWIAAITKQEHFQSGALIATEQQVGHALLQAHYGGAARSVSQAYARAFLGELLHGGEAYQAYLHDHHTPQHTLDTLEARCLHERVLRMFEETIQAMQPPRETGTAKTVYKRSSVS